MSKKIALNNNDIKLIKHTENMNSVHKYFRNKDKLSFQVGDILIKKTVEHWNGMRIKIETVSHISNAPKKYIVVFVDDLGLPYVKPLRVNGEVGDTLTAVINLDLDNYWFEIDPDLAAHVILNPDEEDFDPLERFKLDKERRESIKISNKKLLEKTTYMKDIRILCNKLTPGTTMWFANNQSTCTSVQEYVIHAAQLKLNWDARAAWNNHPRQFNYLSDISIEAYVTENKLNDMWVLWVIDMQNKEEHLILEPLLRGHNVFLSKPQSAKDEI